MHGKMVAVKGGGGVGGYDNGIGGYDDGIGGYDDGSSDGDGGGDDGDSDDYDDVYNGDDYGDHDHDLRYSLIYQCHHLLSFVMSITNADQVLLD